MGWDIYRYKDWISVAQAAKAAGVSRTTIHDWIRDEHVKAKRVSPRKVMVRTVTLTRHLVRTGRNLDHVPGTRTEHERDRDRMLKAWKTCGAPGKKPRLDNDGVIFRENLDYWLRRAAAVQPAKKKP